MKLLCLTDYTYRDNEVTFPFSAGVEYILDDALAEKVMNAIVPTDVFEEVKDKPAPKKGKSDG